MYLDVYVMLTTTSLNEISLQIEVVNVCLSVILNERKGGSSDLETGTYFFSRYAKFYENEFPFAQLIIFPSFLPLPLLLILTI